MINNIKTKSIVIILLLISALLLQGCLFDNMPVYVPPYVPSQPEFEEPPETAVDPSETINTVSGRGRFTLRYEPANSLNPILARNRDNISITSLIYEPLFSLDNNLEPRPILCENWSTDDNIIFIFKILPDIAMHDGSTLTADDVAYSLRQAKSRGRHMAKLAKMSSVTSDGELTVTVTLSDPNARFTRLLDIPIIKVNTIDDELPPGTGPFIFPNPDNYILLRFNSHRNYSFMPVDSIYLKVCNDSELTELFDQGGISLLWDDPVSTYEIRINRDNEPVYFNTSTLQFLGFNNSSGVLGIPAVRRAIGCAIDRQAIVETIMSDPRPGQTVAAPVAISPMFNMYDPAWDPFNDPNYDPDRELGALLVEAMIQDYNDDGLLERNDGSNGPGIPFSLELIVNVENSFKVEAAEYIAATLRQVGFDINVRVLSWDDFLKALNNGDFDIFYGEVQLGADFDFSPLLLPGSGSLDYGNTGDSMYSFYIQNFLSAVTQEEVSMAGKVLCDEIIRTAPFVPILYKRYAIYYPVGAIMGAVPSQSGVFYDFHKWDIDSELLT